MSEGDQIERRVERAAFETDRQVLVGDVTLPPAGYQSRFSDLLNRGDVEFVALTNVEITSLVDGRVIERPFVAVAKSHVRFAYTVGP
ncbi:MAG: hypothetical protein WD810_06515 [Solirubrobacterales bacterium]